MQLLFALKVLLPVLSAANPMPNLTFLTTFEPRMDSTPSEESPRIRCDPEFEEMCETGNECVQKDEFCDGKIDCKDGTDEIPDLCLDDSSESKGRFLPPIKKCPETWFFCRDASKCIEAAAVCNDSVECDDGSDEDVAFCHYTKIERILNSAVDDTAENEKQNATQKT